MKQEQKKYVILGSLCALVLMLVVGYAAFSTILNIKGTSNINSNWDVKITDIKKVSSKGSTDVDGTPKYDNLSATFNTNFTTPGDYATYKIEITNNGSMDAVLKNITMPENTNNDILFYLNKDQSNTDIANALKQNDTLFKKGETGNVGYVYVTVLYRDYENQQTATTKTADMTITFDFEQAEGNSSDTPEEPEEPGFTGTVYRNTSDKLNIGDSIKGIVTQEESFESSGVEAYLKHDVVNNKITVSYLCFVTDKEYCMRGADSSYYLTNKTLLQNQTSWIVNHQTSDGEGCFEISSYYRCTYNRFTTVYAYNNGILKGWDTNGGCYISSSGMSFCGTESDVNI